MGDARGSLGSTVPGVQRSQDQVEDPQVTSHNGTRACDVEEWARDKTATMGGGRRTRPEVRSAGARRRSATLSAVAGSRLLFVCLSARPPPPGRP